MKKLFSLTFIVLFGVSLAQAQQAEVTIQLNEQFFDSLLDAIFKNPNSPSFPLAKYNLEKGNRNSEFPKNINSFASHSTSKIENLKTACDESIKLQREIDGVRTAVKFRDGKIYAPLAFTGSYNPPLIGCIEFSGWAESNIELSFDAEKQALIGRAVLSNVQLSGTNGIGSNLITKLVQSSIDKKMNPLQILSLEKVSFVVPIQNSGSVKMKAVNLRPEISNGVLNVHIVYEFLNN